MNGVSTVSDEFVEMMAMLTKLVRSTGGLGLYVNDNGGIVVVLPSSGTSTFRAVDAAYLGLRVSIETQDIEPEDVAAIKELVRTQAWHADARKYTIKASFDPRIGKVRLITNGPPDLVQRFNDQFPGLTLYEHEDIRRTSRRNDVDPHWGGAAMDRSDINLSAWCSSGYGVVAQGGADRMVTAGHCAYDTVAGVMTDSDYFDSPNGTMFGYVKDKSHFPLVDAMLVGGSGIDHGRKIYIGDNIGVEAHVYGAEDAQFGVEYCYSGATTYEHCLQYMEDDWTPYCDDLGCTIIQDFRGRITPDGGDSGGPVYRFTTGGPGIASSHVKIVGSVVGGDANDGHSWGDTDIQAWEWVRAGYDVTIKHF